MFSLFTCPHFQDNEINRKATIFYNLVIATMVIVSFMECIEMIVLPLNYMRWLIVIGCINFICMLLLYLNKKGLTTIASYFYSVSILILLFILSWTGGGIGSLAVQKIPIVIVIIGLILGWREGIYITIIITIVSFGLVVADWYGILPVNTVILSPFSLWVNSMINLVFIGFLLYLVIGNLDKSLIETKIELSFRKKTEDELRESEIFRKRVFESSMIPIIIMDADTLVFIDCNQAAITINGFSSREETLGKTPFSISAPLQYDGSTSEEKSCIYIDKALQEGSAIFEWKLKRLNGELWDSEVHLMSFIIENKHYFQFTLLDITQRKIAENELRLSEERFHDLWEASVEGIVIHENGIILELNSAICVMFGVTYNELIGKSIFDFVPESNHTKLIEHIEKGSTVSYETKGKKIDGSILELELFAKEINFKGKVTRMVACRDITERKKSEEIIRANEQRLHLATSTGNIGIWDWNIEKNVLNWDTSMYSLYGIKKDDFNGAYQAWIQTIHPDDKAYNDEEIQAAINGEKEYAPEFRIIRPDGTLRILKASSFTFRDSNNNAYRIIGTNIDITERKMSEEALRESEARFRFISENIDDLLWSYSLSENRFTFISSGVQKLRGFTPEEVLHQKMENILTPESYQRAMSTIQSAILQRKPSDTGNFHSVTLIDQYRKDGSIVPTEISSSLVFNDKGEPVEIIGLTHDITDRIRNEEILRESEEKFRIAFDNAPTGMSIIDDKFNYIEVNPLLCEMFGYSKDEFLKQNIKLVTHPDDMERSNEWIMKKMNGEPCEAVFEKRFIHKDGHIVWGLVSSQWIKTNNGNNSMAITHLLDVTEFKKAEKELKEGQERYRKLVEAIPDMLVLMDIEGNFLYGNEPFERITGIIPDDYANPKRIANVHSDDVSMVNEALKVFLESKRAHSQIIDYRFIDSWGKIHWFSGKASKLKMNDQIVLQMITRDITESKKIEKELERYRDHLKQEVQVRTEELDATIEELHSANEDLYNQKEELENAIESLRLTQNKLIQSEKMASIGLLSAGIAHEINNPLNFIHGGILGIEDYLIENAKEHYETINPLIKAVNIGVDRASKIVTSLSHYSRRDDLSFTQCEIHSIIENCLVILQNQIKNKVEIHKQFASESITIIANEGKLHQVLLNILSNAEQSIEKKGIITIETHVKDNNCMIIVSDNGSGISKDNIQKIFDPFFTTKAPGKGTGLGLSITYNIIKEHNGTIDFDSELGQGTKVIITIPQRLIE
jgi:PAS domain S-box-containing protein